MKKAVAFLFAFLIFVTPITTFVKADVVIGNNDETIINENAAILGRKLALLESFSDLALSGVTEFTISDTNDLDSYLDSLWSELNDAIDSLSDGTGYTEISNALKSKYYTNLVQYQDYINNRGDYLSHLLPSGNPTTSLLSTYFANNIFGKHSTLHNNLSLDAFKALSEYRNNNNQPIEPHPDFSFLDNIAYLYVRNMEFVQNLSVPWAYNNGSGQIATWNFTRNLVTYYSPSTYLRHIYTDNNYMYYGTLGIYNGILSVNFNTQTLQAEYYGAVPFSGVLFSSVNGDNTGNSIQNVTKNYGTYNGVMMDYMSVNGSDNNTWIPRTDFTGAGISTFCNYIYNQFANINIYVDGQPWVICSPVSINPSLDIDGFLKVYGNDDPVQYQLQPNTQIDYDQLYQVIYNAIRDNLPISQGDINYYDSHDTIYSPTIINNYGEDEGDESDLIDTILDYAIIPKFDTAIAQPMRSALTNGVVIMNNSITNVIPNEILFILGACFFLLLFAVVINRMIK